MSPEISIIIPTLNEENSLRETLDSLKNFDNAEIIIVDGGSSDTTILIAEAYNVKVLHSLPGRGIQLQAGAMAAQGQILWFLHADTITSTDAVWEITRVLNNPQVIGGNFTIRFDGNSRAAKFLTWLYPKLRKINLIYGDSAIFVRREVYQKLGGFKPFALFEDLDLIERLQPEGELITLSAVVTTSSRRFERRNFILIFLKWVTFQILYWLGFNPNNLAKYYYPIRKS